MKARQLTQIAFMAAIMVCVFQLCSNILYLELITFTIVLFASVFQKKTAIVSCIVFALLNMMVMGITLWTLLYLMIYPLYAWIIASWKLFLMKHPLCLCIVCGCLSFLCGQLLDLPFLLFGKQATLVYVLMGLKTSLIQGILSFVTCMLLFDPLYLQMSKLEKERGNEG
ncbi:MAG: cytochrome b [Erysipelotrichaceae bacterium]|nr:cytochrome b [Erysipelotrichaceae bacterium]MCI9523497.1 cytochrome b [Erysipelotrichaceae bacterium]